MRQGSVNSLTMATVGEVIDALGNMLSLYQVSCVCIWLFRIKPEL